MNILQKHFSPYHLFLLGILLHLVVVLQPAAFVTHDGPSHLYNAHIINQILFSEGSIHEQYHALNPNWLQPNLLGYLPLCLFQLFIPFLWAEKITVALYVLLFSFGFRFFLKQVSPRPNWYALLALPFIFNVVLFWGFFNFLFALALSFYLLGSYEKYLNKPGMRSILLLLFLSLLVFYSHVLVFVFCGIYVFIRQIHTLISAKTWTPMSFWNIFKPALFLLPGALLFLLYLSKQTSEAAGTTEVFDLGDRLDNLWLKIESLSFSGYSEGAYVVPMYLIILLLAGAKILHDKRRKISLWSVSFLVMLFFLFALLFTPNAAAGGSVIIPRLNLVFFLFLLVWIAKQDLTRPVKWMLGIYFIWSLPLLVQRYSFIQAASLQSTHVMEATLPFLQKNTVISSVHYKPVSRYLGDYQIHTYFDMMSNIDHYAALARGCLTLHNYEADRPVDNSYFPVIWKDTAMVDIIWDRSLPDQAAEYIQLDTLLSHAYPLPVFSLNIGEPMHNPAAQKIWDSLNRYEMVAQDSVSFLTIYRLR